MRLTSATAGSSTTSYSYDRVGNRLSKTASPSSPVSSTYDRADRIKSAGGVSYTPDANGNVVGRGSDTFRYDAANRLISASVGLQTQAAELQALTNHTTSSSYRYDGDGLRASKTAGTTTQYIWDIVGTPTLLEDGSRTYVWGPGHSYSESSDGTLDVLHQDVWRSVRAVSNVSGKLSFSEQFDRYGVSIETEGTTTTPFKFAELLQNQETGFLGAAGCVYDPAVDRCMNAILRGLHQSPCKFDPNQVLQWPCLAQAKLGPFTSLVPFLGIDNPFGGGDKEVAGWGGSGPDKGLAKAAQTKVSLGTKVIRAIQHLFSVGARGEELASEELLDAVRRHGRRIFQDEETQSLLDYFKANASSSGPHDISLRLDPRKIEVLEEFLHGTQARRGWDRRMSTAQLELQVKGFMIRHRRLLGISDADVLWLQKSMEMYR